MGLGIRLRELFRMRRWVAVCFALSLFAAVWSVAKVSPTGLHSRSLTMASASTEVVVDTPKSTLVDARADTYNIDGLVNRAVLVGNLMATTPVRDAIAKQANVPPELLHIAPPLTPREPYMLADSGNERHTTDIVKANDAYRIVITANPTVPVLRIYALTRDTKSASALANAAVDATSKRLDQLATAGGTGTQDKIKLMQLGKAKGDVIDNGMRLKTAFLAFLVTFGLTCASAVFIRRVREGWRLAALADAKG